MSPLPDAPLWLRRYFWLLVLLLPWTWETGLGAGVQLTVPLEPLLAAFAPLLLLLRGRYLRRQPLLIAGAAFLLAALLSVVDSEWWQVSAKAWLILSTYAFVFLAGPPLLGFGRAEWQQTALLYGISVAALWLYSLGKLAVLGLGYHQSYAMAAPFNAGHTLLVAMGFPLWLLVADRILRGRAQVHEWLFALLGVAVILLSFSRFYWVLLPGMGFLLLLRYRPVWRPWLIGLVLVALLSGGVTYVYLDRKYDAEKAWLDPTFHTTVFAQVQSIFVLEKNKSNTERLNRWRVAWAMFEAQPLTGAGLNVFAEHQPRYATALELEETYREYDKMNAHQLFLGWLAEMGLLGLLTGLLLWIVAGWATWQLRGQPLFLFACLLYGNFFLLGLIEDYTLDEDLMPLFWLWLAWLGHRRQMAG